jgi:DNA-directed RNA polymerase specialized sigma24 family protein
LETVADPSSLPDEMAAIRQLVQQLRLAKEKLRDEFRAVLHQRFAEELPFKNIADSIGAPFNTIMSLYKRGLRALRKDFLEENFNPPAT